MITKFRGSHPYLTIKNVDLLSYLIIIDQDVKMDAYFQKKMKCSFVQKIKKAVHYFLMRKIYGVFHISRSIVQVTWLSFQN